MKLRSRKTLIELLEGADLSERQLARTAGLGHATVNHLITGRRDTCAPRTARAIEKALDCDAGTLFVADTDADRFALRRLIAAEQDGLPRSTLRPRLDQARPERRLAHPRPTAVLRKAQ